tara:strand:- start:108 stop:611 length:504 start_codon:yes stop_codon:yes gene_type:complete
MNKIISLPLLLLVLNFNAQKDFITKYDLKTFVSNNYELIENFNPKKNNERIKFNKLLSQHIKKNNGKKAYFSDFLTEFPKDLKNHPNWRSYYIKRRDRVIISLLINGIGISTIAVWAEGDLFAFIIAAIIILPPTFVISLIPFIGISKIKAQLHKDYFLSISSANTN